ncbi:hypothetical protein DVH24_035402 [Malus domestica]|uniref:Disease resistance protein At4g27190-like leucine-rich repeats domain-containing protein n=1 Tax=Malus domestica TaxID=3750 RepID=A0A498J4V0_MALDO|nr:hypothetical protein DVH24_035402 [Malus domestica]
MPLPLIIFQDKSFLKLEYLILDENTEILYGPLLAELLRKLKGIGFATSHPKSDVFFENFQNIEILCVFSAPWKELIVHNHRGSSSTEIHEVETLPCVKVLCLSDMPELIHLGKENSQPRGRVFPNLEFLGLEKCSRLENLASTLISFRNLTTFTIRDCHGLQYLIPYSVAKNLQQLKNLEVESCERMVEIVASNGDDTENEITFSCLQDLKLCDLPSLQGFCTGNCIFKVPSLPSKNLIVEKCQLIELNISPDGLLQSDPRPETLQIAEETDDARMLSDSKENDRDQTDQLMIADSNVDVTIARLSAKKESSSFGWSVKVFRLCAIACLCVIFLFLLFFLLKEEISAWRVDWKAL